MMEPGIDAHQKVHTKLLRTQGRVSLTHSGETTQIILPLEQIQLFYKPIMRMVFILAFVRWPHVDHHSSQEE